jgi:hypothetical protein
MSQGYFLERTASAKSVLEKAMDLCSDKVIEFTKFFLFLL